jgi:hypothetical protein
MDNIDRISDLPDNVIDGILEHLGIKTKLGLVFCQKSGGISGFLSHNLSLNRTFLVVSNILMTLSM